VYGGYNPCDTPAAIAVNHPLELSKMGTFAPSSSVPFGAGQFGGFGIGIGFGGF